MVALMERIREENRLMSEDVRNFLSGRKNTRIAQTQEQAEQLHQFKQQLEQETDTFLAATAQARIAQAQAQRKSLYQFRQDLFASVMGKYTR